MLNILPCTGQQSPKVPIVARLRNLSIAKRLWVLDQIGSTLTRNRISHPQSSAKWDS